MHRSGLWMMQAGGYYYLSPACAPGSNLDINGGFTANGSKVQIWTKGTGNSQKFK